MFLGRLSNQMQHTFQKALTNTIKTLSKKVATKWTFLLLCKTDVNEPSVERGQTVILGLLYTYLFSVLKVKLHKYSTNYFRSHPSIII